MKQRIWFFSTVVISLLLSVIALAPANAIQGGSSALGDSRVVALVFGTNTRASCSGVPLNPYVVVAAAHCLSNPGMSYSAEKYLPKGLSIGDPGADLTKDNQSARPIVLQAAVSIGFNDKYPTDDLAFYFLDRPLVNATFLPIATSAEMESVKRLHAEITHLGYGYILPGNVEDFRPHKIILPANEQSSLLFNLFSPTEIQSISTAERPGFALCKHDSGGPFIASIEGVEKVLAINLLADGCDRNGAGVPVKGTLGMAIFPYLDLLERNWQEYSQTHSAIVGISEASSQLKELITAARATAIAKASPTPAASPKVGTDVKSTPKILSITCMKAKKTLVIKGAAPTCPAGYKKK